jgi:hypothetical protein
LEGLLNPFLTEMKVTIPLHLEIHNMTTTQTARSVVENITTVVVTHGATSEAPRETIIEPVLEVNTEVTPTEAAPEAVASEAVVVAGSMIVTTNTNTTIRIGPRRTGGMRPSWVGTQTVDHVVQ